VDIVRRALVRGTCGSMSTRFEFGGHAPASGVMVCDVVCEVDWLRADLGLTREGGS
jgi:hypothetical protein